MLSVSVLSSGLALSSNKLSINYAMNTTLDHFCGCLDHVQIQIISNIKRISINNITFSQDQIVVGKLLI